MHLTGPSNSEPGAAAITVDESGRIIVAGCCDGVDVGRLGRDGSLDRSFGSGGWAAVAPPTHDPVDPQAEQVLSDTDGRTIVGVDSYPSGCCSRFWLTALTPAGRLDTSFGNGGWAEVDMTGIGPDEGIAGLYEEPDGSILVEAIGGNMGTYGIDVIKFSSTGQADPAFSQSFHAVWDNLVFDASFVGHMFLRGNGAFGIVGFSASGFAAEDPMNPTPTGFSVGFTSEGTLDTGYGHGGDVSYPGTFQGDAVVPWAEGSMIQELDYASPAGSQQDIVVGFRQLTSQGFINPDFGVNGRVVVSTTPTTSSPYQFPPYSEPEVLAAWPDRGTRYGSC